MIFIACFITLATCDWTANFLHDAASDEREARCLDGSPGNYYFSPGFGSGADKWHVHMQGGAWCTEESSCYVRATQKWSMAGTKNDVPHMSESELGQEFGYFSRNATLNPIMFNYNFAFLRYCDGFSFAGNYPGPRKAKKDPDGPEIDIYLRGFALLNAMIDHLVQNRSMAKAKEVVVGGCSAGGQAVYLHCDHWANRLAFSGAEVRCFADSGYFQFQEKGWWNNLMMKAVNYHQAWDGLHPKCVEEKGQQNNTCFLADVTGEYIQTPIFSLQSRVDSWQVDNILCGYNQECMKNSTLINSWAKNITQSMQNSLLSKRQNGIFLDTCSHHCGTWPVYDTITIEQFHPRDAFEKWMNNDKSVLVSDDSWPCESCCNGHKPGVEPWDM